MENVRHGLVLDFFKGPAIPRMIEPLRGKRGLHHPTNKGVFHLPALINVLMIPRCLINVLLTTCDDSCVVM